MDVSIWRRAVTTCSLAVVVCVALAAGAASSASAMPASVGSAPANFTWSGASTTGSNWSDAANWGGTAPSGAVGTLTFPRLTSCPGSAACDTATDDVSGISTPGLNVDSGSTYDIAGAGPLSLGGLTLSTTSAPVSGASVTITTPLTLSASQTWGVGASSPNEPITFGSISGVGDSLTMSLSSSPTVGLSGNVDVGQLNLTGYGSVRLAGGVSVDSSGGPVSVGTTGSGATLSVPSGSAQSGPLTVAPGNYLSIGGTSGAGTAGSLAVNGGLTFTAPGSGSPTFAEFNMPGGAGGASGITVNGNVSLSGQLMVTRGGAGSCPTFSPGTTFTLIATTGGSISGTFANSYVSISCPGTSSSQSAAVTYTSTAVTLTIPKDSTNGTATCTPSQVKSGTSTTCSATLTDISSSGATPPTGTITFTPSSGATGSFGPGGSSCTLAGSGAATSTCSVTFTPTSATSGSASLSVSYPGDSSHGALTTQYPPTAYIYVSPPDTTSTGISCSPQSVARNVSTTCSVTVHDNGYPATSPPGSVTVTAAPSSGQLGNGGTCTLSAGATGSSTCQVTFSAAAFGNYALTATYGGSAGYQASTGTVTVQVANPTSTELTCLPSSVNAGTAVLCTAIVTDTTSGYSGPTGSVVFSFPSKWSATKRTCTLATEPTNASSSCQITITPTTSGTTTVVAIYSGDSGHQPSSGRAPVTVQGGAGGGPISGPPGTQCSDPYPSVSDPSNRLMLAQAPGADPLRGASFFVNGPAHGFAASAIARLLGIDSHTPVDSVLPDVPESESWVDFQATIPALEAKMGNNPTIDREVALLSKIASQPETQRVSSFSQGGGPGKIYSQTQKLFCHNFLADPSAVPVISTYFLHPVLFGCPSPKQIKAYWPVFKRRVDEVAQGTGNRPAVFLVEIDGIGSSGCMAKRGDLGLWLADIKYEDLKLRSLPHTLVYVEAGYSDSNSPRYTAKALLKVGIKQIDGFWTNDTHINWTMHEIRWAMKISRMAGGAHFVVNTAQNGHGPKLNRHPTTQGIENLCNPPGRGLGPNPTTTTGFGKVDAYLWTSPPGMSSGPCNGGTPSGTFWLGRAVSLAAAATNLLGP